MISELKQTTRPLVDRDNPWPGPESFDEAAAEFFNGRTEESAELKRLILTAPLTVLFGASGLGKTSLIQAGLFPLIRPDFLPIYVRLDLSESALPFGEQLKSALLEQIAAHGVDAPSFGEGESLWRYLHRPNLELWSRQNRLLTPLFILDQFEEVHILAANPKAVDALRLELADLVENRLPQKESARRETVAALELDSQPYKVVMSFREDYLPRFETWKRQIPSIMRNRYRLLPMSEEQAFQAVHTTSGGLVDVGIAERIVRTVAAAQDEEGESSAAARGGEHWVDPALLSIFCEGLNEKRKQRGKSQIDYELLDEAGTRILEDFYERAMGDQPEHVKRFVATQLITEKGYRDSYDVDDALALHGVTREELNRLVDRRLLRIEPYGRTEHVELTHDVLTNIVRNERARWQARERARGMRRRVGILGLVALALIGLVALFLSLWLKEKSDTRGLAERNSELSQLNKSLNDANFNLTAMRNQLQGQDAKLQERAAQLQQLTGELQERTVAAETATRNAVAALTDWQDETRRARKGFTDDESSISYLTDQVIEAQSPLEATSFHRLKSVALDELGMHKKAAQEIDKSLEAAPDYLRALKTRGYQRLLTGQITDAVRDSEAYLHEFPRDEIASLNLALGKAMLGPEHYTEAKRAVADAISAHDPANSGASDSEIDPDIQMLTGHRSLSLAGWEYLIALKYESAVLDAWAGKPGFRQSLDEADVEAELRHHPSVNAPLAALNWAWLQFRERPDDYGLLAASGALWERVAKFTSRTDLKGCAPLKYLQFEKSYSDHRLKQYDWLAGWVKGRNKSPGACNLGRLTPDARDLVTDADELQAQAQELEAQAQEDNAFQLIPVERKLSSAIEKIENDPKERDFLIELLVRRAGIRYREKGYIDKPAIRADCKKALALDKNKSERKPTTTLR